MKFEPLKLEISTHSFPAGDTIPNHPELPLLRYRQAKPRGSIDLASWFQQTFRRNGWGGTWRWTVFDYHHFHPNAHEVLGVARGNAVLQLGGPQGEPFEVEAGDAVLIPAGVGHMRLEASRGFQVIGAYPPGQEAYDTLTALPDPPDPVLRRIREVPVPDRDPLYNREDGVIHLWPVN